MHVSECNAVADLLVEYADGATSSIQSSRVERHVAECDACRRELAALQRSLCALEAVWAEGRLHLRSVQPGVHNAAATTEYRVKTLSLGGSEAYKWLAALGGLAAAVVIAIGLYQTVPRADDPVVAASPDDRFASGSNSAALQVDVDKLDIEAFLRRQEQSARLATSARLLAAAPVDPQDAERARRYLREAYGIEQSSTMTSHANEL